MSVHLHVYTYTYMRIHSVHVSVQSKVMRYVNCVLIFSTNVTTDIFLNLKFSGKAVSNGYKDSVIRHTDI